MMGYSGEVQPEDMKHLFSKTRLIRTEVSTLVGLLLRNDIDYTLPAPDVMQEHITDTEALLNELHQTFFRPFLASLEQRETAEQELNPFTSGAVLREPIFYGGESAYDFQYRDLSPKKYSKDDRWLLAKNGFSIQSATEVVRAVGRFLVGKALATLNAMRSTPPEKWTFLACNSFTVTDIAGYSRIDLDAVTRVLAAFAVRLGERNEQFAALDDFNIVNALPLIPVNEDAYILFHVHSLAEALYESPFYWMAADTSYVSTAMRHRGSFTEEFAAERLVRVFGKENVHPNVDVFDPTGAKLGEIDVLVLFGDRAIVLQAKSKRLTLESRKGNDGQIRDDFKKAIQDSCDQAYKCAAALCQGNYTFRNARSEEVSVYAALSAVYVLCLVSDHYPALSFQTRQFIEFEATRTIPPPFVLDVFTLDAMTEMLDSPLHLLSYVDRRTRYFQKVIASHEMTILSYHLKHSLWLASENDLLALEDDISIDLDIAMLARREGLPGERTPDGILTRFAATTVGRAVREIERHPEPVTLDLGYALLMLGEQAVNELSHGIDEIIRRVRSDTRRHDFTIGLADGDTGLTAHCTDEPIETAWPVLERHCETRKYSQRARTWFGICISPNDGSLRFGLELDYAWEHSEDMEKLTRRLGQPRKLTDMIAGSNDKRMKIGRNAPCPCGSGRKYKKCCLLR